MKMKNKTTYYNYLSIIVCSTLLLFVSGCYNSSNNNDITLVESGFDNSESDKSQPLLTNEQKLIDFVVVELSKPTTIVTLNYIYDRDSSRNYEYILKNKDITISLNVYHNIVPNKFDIYYELFVNKEKVFSGNGKSELVERLKELFNKKIEKTNYRKLNEEQIKNFLSDFQIKH